jgi:hypothetical protein
MQLAARGLWCACCLGQRPVALRPLPLQLRIGPPGGAWSVHGGRQLMREPFGFDHVEFSCSVSCLAAWFCR